MLLCLFYFVFFLLQLAASLRAYVLKHSAIVPYTWMWGHWALYKKMYYLRVPQPISGRPSSSHPHPTLGELDPPFYCHFRSQVETLSGHNIWGVRKGVAEHHLMNVVFTYSCIWIHLLFFVVLWNVKYLSNDDGITTSTEYPMQNVA